VSSLSLLDIYPGSERRGDGEDKEERGRKAGRLKECHWVERKADDRFNTIDESKRMCPHLYVQHVATYRNGESEAGYWGEVDPKSHKVSSHASFPIK